jgi:hypothetical protein
VVLAPVPCSAKPQWNAGVEGALCGTGGALGLSNLGFCGSLHGDVLLLRGRSSDFGLGPSLRLGTAGFDDFRLDAGLSALVPVFDSFPLVLEAGPHLRNLTQPGIFASAFFGLRPFNHYGPYEMAAGLVLTAQRSFVTGTPSALWIGLRVDGSWLALPFIFAYNAAR